MEEDLKAQELLAKAIEIARDPNTRWIKWKIVEAMGTVKTSGHHTTLKRILETCLSEHARRRLEIPDWAKKWESEVIPALKERMGDYLKSLRMPATDDWGDAWDGEFI